MNKKEEEDIFYQHVELKNRKVCRMLLSYSSTRGFSEEQLYLEFKTFYEDEHQDRIFTYSDFEELKKVSLYFRSILEECHIRRKIYFLNLGLDGIVSRNKVNSSLYSSFMRNEFGWDKDKEEDKDLNFSEIKVHIVDDEKST